MTGSSPSETRIKPILQILVTTALSKKPALSAGLLVWENNGHSYGTHHGLRLLRYYEYVPNDEKDDEIQTQEQTVDSAASVAFLLGAIIFIT